MKQILILTVGGTIDKVYFDALSDYQVGPSTVEQLLATAQATIDPRIEAVMRKDSLDMSDDDREKIRDLVVSCKERHVVITHGTDTMVRTAETLQTVEGKTIVLTGALSPARFAQSDAPFNLGMAIAAAQVAQPGVWIALNGTVFPADRVRKDRENNRFVASPARRSESEE
jgi:L-asparaginase